MYIKLNLKELLFFDDSLTLSMSNCPGLITSQLLDKSSGMIIAAPENLINKMIDGIAFIIAEKKEEVVVDLDRFEIMILREVVKISNQEILSEEEIIKLKIKVISCLHEASDDYVKLQNAREFFMTEEAKSGKS